VPSEYERLPIFIGTFRVDPLGLDDLGAPTVRSAPALLCPSRLSRHEHCSNRQAAVRPCAALAQWQTERKRTDESDRTGCLVDIIQQRLRVPVMLRGADFKARRNRPSQPPGDARIGPAGFVMLPLPCRRATNGAPGDRRSVVCQPGSMSTGDATTGGTSSSVITPRPIAA